MQVNDLKITYLRNHINSYFQFSNETIITGYNGSGKTSLLESIFILFGLRSFKKQPFSSVVTFESDFFRIESNVSDNMNISNIVCIYKNKRTNLIDGEEVDNIADYVYNYPVACYTPEYTGVLSKDQQDRRNFLDRFIFYYDKEHIYDIKLYNRFISQKQAEYEKENIDFTYIDLINEKIISLSEKIYNKRLKFIGEVNKNLIEIYSNLDFSMENVFLNYTTNISDHSLLNKEKFLKKSLYGIHKDRIDMFLNNKVIEKFSSTGQKKTFSLLSLFSFIKIIEDNRNINMVTLLDDFEAALDIKRALFLKELFSKNRQVIYTGVDNSRLGFKNIIELK